MTKELNPFFHPRSVAVVGASRSVKKWGTLILHNIIVGGFKGKVYPVNPSKDEIFGITVYPTLKEIPDEIDLVIIVVPREKVIGVLDDAAKKGVRCAVLITAGYSETGDSGKALEEETVRFAQDNKIKLIGPNCMGIVSMIPERLVSWMPSLTPKPGPVSIVSQSGNVGYSLVQALNNRGLGVCRTISSGNEGDLTISDFISYLKDDPETKAVLLYIEGVDDGRNFIEDLKEVTPEKPVMVLKTGHTDAGARASASHTGAMSGSDTIYDSVFIQSGAIRARDLEEMVDMAQAFSSQPIPGGRRVGIITMGGGWGVLAADACDQAGLEVVPLKSETKAELDKVLPFWWSRSNPVDLAAGLREENLYQSLTTILKCDYIDSVMLLGIGYGFIRGSFIKGSPYSQRYDMKEVGEIYIKSDEIIAEEIIDLLDKYKKPIIPVVDQTVIEKKGDFVEILKSRGILLFSSPLRGAVALSALTRYGEYVRERTTS